MSDSDVRKSRAGPDANFETSHRRAERVIARLRRRGNGGERRDRDADADWQPAQPEKRRHQAEVSRVLCSAETE